MKLSDLLLKQNIIVQLSWGDQKIEFTSEVIDTSNESAYVTSYIHNGSELQLNITEGSVVVCNVFADDSLTGQRISWRNVELTTVDKNGKTAYCIKAHGFNNVAKLDDRRYNERTIIKVDGTVLDPQDGEIVNIKVHDVSGVGVAFHAPKNYAPKSQQIVVNFSDLIDDKNYDVKVNCVISRMNMAEDHVVVGCRLTGENRDYQLYRFIKQLKSKSGNKPGVPENENQTDKEVEEAKEVEIVNEDKEVEEVKEAKENKEPEVVKKNEAGDDTE